MNKLSLCKLPAAAATDPVGIMKAMLQHVDLDKNPPLHSINWSGPKLNHQPLQQIFILFTETFSKAEFLAKFQRIKEMRRYEHAEHRGCAETEALYTLANQRLRRKSGITHLGMHHNRVEIRTCNDEQIY